MKIQHLAAIALPALLLVLGSTATAEKDEKDEKKAAKCPISGKPADLEVSLNVNGKPVYFCCNKCPKGYKEKIKLVADKEKKCVLRGKPANPAKMLIHKKVELVTFCCNDCRGKWAAENKIAFKDGSGKCPITGKPGKDATAIVVNGEKVTFCCNKCKGKYTKDLQAKAANKGNCPKTGKPGKAETGIFHVTSKEVNFCCGNCQGKYIKQHFAEKKGKEKKKVERTS